MRPQTQITAECPCGSTLTVKASTTESARHILGGWTNHHHAHQEDQ